MHNLQLALVLFVASLLHSVVGFAFALFAIPVLLLGGMQPYEAIARDIGSLRK